MDYNYKVITRIKYLNAGSPIIFYGKNQIRKYSISINLWIRSNCFSNRHK